MFGNNRRWTHTLMCVDVEVANLEIGISEILNLEILQSRYLPIGVSFGPISLMNWFSRRRIPASRAHLERMEWVIGSIDSAVYKSFGLSLSDSYWIRPCDSDLEWGSVNFFENDFSDDVGEYLMTESTGGVDLNSPSINTEGMVPKKWIVDSSGFRRLVKGPGRFTFWQYNEVAAFRVGKALGIPILPYALCDNNRNCFCPCMIKSGQNLVTADDILREKIPDHSSTETGWYDNDPHLYEILCGEFGKEYVDSILIFDYVVRNRDRHTRNIAKIQDAVTRKWIRNSPIFDNGSSLMENLDPFNDKAAVEVAKWVREDSRPFCSPHDIQINLVDLSPFLPKLKEAHDSGEIIAIIVDTYKTSRINVEIVSALAKYIHGLVGKLIKMG